MPEADRQGDLSAAYSRLPHSDDPAVRARAAQDWCDREDVHVSLAPDAAPFLSVADPAFQLHRAWPGSELVVLDDAGHGGSSTSRAMVAATDCFVSHRGPPEGLSGKS